MENPIPTKAFDRLVELELAALATLLAESGKSVAVVVIAGSGALTETYGVERVKPSDRVAIEAGLARVRSRYGSADE